MKRQEKTHLKEDPFLNFVEKALFFFKNNKKPIIAGAGLLIIILIAFLGINWIRSGNTARENRKFVKAIKIRDDQVLTLDEKISRLKQLGGGRKIAASIRLMMAQIYFENGEFEKAEATVKDFPASSLDYLNSAQQVMLADILKVRGKYKEAESILQTLLTTKETEMSKDYLMLKLAKIQIDAKESKTAKGMLEQLLADFPQSPLSSEARELLTSIKGT